MIYFHSTGDVHNNLIEETVLIAAFPGNPTEIDQNPNVPPNLVQLAQRIDKTRPVLVGTECA